MASLSVICLQTEQRTSPRVLAAGVELTKYIEAIKYSQIKGDKFKRPGDVRAQCTLTPSSSGDRVCEQVSNQVCVSDQAIATARKS